MAGEVSLSFIGYFMPVFSFLLVFIVIYAVLFKTKVLGDNQPVMLFVSFILSSFFIVQASLVEFVEFTSSWFAVLVIGVFFLIAIVGFIPGKEPFKFLGKSSWFSWVVLGVIIGLFVISSAYVFNWAVNWGTVQDWFDTSWFGMILLLAVAAVVSWKIKK